ncbi:hypothetical protein [Nonomuraea cavernae]|uniref:hypothetical protein n=1 Tax=Nonomuraea cavernae TaxID=2045107 RepID=UPI0033BFF0F8
MTDLSIKPGQIVTRAEMTAIVGGGSQGGIIPSATTNNILLYSDHDSGAQFGYYDGWLAEGDADGPLFEYTGAGRIGDQTFTGPNKAVLHHVDTQKALHVFIAVGVVPGTKTKTHRYLGQFQLDDQQPYVIRRAPDEKGDLRWAIVFNLRPIGTVQRTTQDQIPPAPRTTALRVPAEETTSKLVAPETNTKFRSRRPAVPKTEAQRREAQLTDDYMAYLKTQHHVVERFQIKIKGLTSTFFTDIYDSTANILYEAKSSSSRDAVRMAIGQLFDYRRHVLPIEPLLAILLPAEPHNDLQDLLASLDIKLIYPKGGEFFCI